MVQATQLAIWCLVLLAIAVKPGGAAEQQFTCKGQVIHEATNPADQSKPIDLNVTLDDKNKLSMKTAEGKMLAPRITSNNKIQLKFATKDLLENISTIPAIYFSSTPRGNWRGSIARASDENVRRAREAVNVRQYSLEHGWIGCREKRR